MIPQIYQMMYEIPESVGPLADNGISRNLQEFPALHCITVSSNHCQNYKRFSCTLTILPPNNEVTFLYTVGYMMRA